MGWQETSVPFWSEKLKDWQQIWEYIFGKWMPEDLLSKPRENPDGSCNLSITAHPSGEKESIMLSGMVDSENLPNDQKMELYMFHK